MQKVNPLTSYSVAHPKLVVYGTVAATLLALVFLPRIKVDTDPENMLSPQEPVRVFYNQLKRDFTLYDFVIMGAVNTQRPEGVFNPETLRKVHGLTAEIVKMPGVVAGDVQSFSVLDDVVPDGPGTIRFSYLMKDPPKTREEALRIRDRAQANPLFYGTLVSEDGQALTMFIPLESKDRAHGVYTRLKELTSKLTGGGDEFHITGLPVAEDTFGVEMFIQMAVAAPAAMLVIFALLWFFFRQMKLILIPLLLAMVSTLITMGVLIGSGFTVHIMSSMIPIFIMPYSVADSVHILSAFYDAYPRHKDRAATIRAVMKDLFVPCLYTSITTIVGFASLAMTPIPPVQVFGAFVAAGVALAWLLTMTFVPASIMLLVKEESLKDYGYRVRLSPARSDSHPTTALDAALRFVAGTTLSRAKLWLTAVAIVIAVAVYGLSTLHVNDNPIKWFGTGHPIRTADRVLNQHFGGTYEVYLSLEPADDGVARAWHDVRRLIDALDTSDVDGSPAAIRAAHRDFEGRWSSGTRPSLRELDLGIQKLIQEVEAVRNDVAPRSDSDEPPNNLATLVSELEQIRVGLHVFKSPALLRYVQTMQKDIAQQHPLIGKSNSLADITRKVHMELHEGDPAQDRIPDSPEAVAQCLLSTMNSHNADDLWHLVDRSYGKLSVMLQLKSGDNRDVASVEHAVSAYLDSHPAPTPLKHDFAGLSHINVVWQQRMVHGMNFNLLTSFVAVWLMMVVLFRSLRWGTLSMLPLAVTLAAVYGFVGLVGKDYDMPVAVLSSIALGMSVDFAIHFLESVRASFEQSAGARSDPWSQRLQQRWKYAQGIAFQTPARAIFRNAAVVALGFTPLLLSPLVPYNTVGILIGSTMILSAAATLIVLPAIISLRPAFFFRLPRETRRAAWALDPTESTDG